MPELRNKRPGAERHHLRANPALHGGGSEESGTPQQEAIALARLIGRRADAQAVFLSAGRIARVSFERTSPVTRRVILGVAVAAGTTAGAAPGAAHRRPIPEWPNPPRRGLATTRDTLFGDGRHARPRSGAAPIRGRVLQELVRLLARSERRRSNPSLCCARRSGVRNAARGMATPVTLRLSVVTC